MWRREGDREWGFAYYLGTLYVVEVDQGKRRKRWALPRLRTVLYQISVSLVSYKRDLAVQSLLVPVIYSLYTQYYIT